MSVHKKFFDILAQLLSNRQGVHKDLRSAEARLPYVRLLAKARSQTVVHGKKFQHANNIPQQNILEEAKILS